MRITFKNSPKLSQHIADRKFDERRTKLAAGLENLIKTTELFAGNEVTAEFVHQGVSSLVCIITGDKGKYVLKIPLSLTDGGGSEALFLKKWESVRVKVPHIFAEGILGDHPYAIMEYIDAPILVDLVKKGDADEDVYLKMGKILALMHKPIAHGYGRIIGGKPQCTSFKEWLLSEDIKKRISTVQVHNLLGDEHGSISKAFEILIAYSNKRANSSFCHFDFSTSNIFVTDPFTIFDPSPMLNLGIIDIGRTIFISYLRGDTSAGDQLRKGYYEAVGIDADLGVLQASIILTAYWKFSHIYKKNRVKDMDRARENLRKTRHLLF